MNREEKIAEAQRLRAEGLSYAKVAARLGIGATAAFDLLNPEKYKVRKRKEREKNRARPGFKELQGRRHRKWVGSLTGRCQRALITSRNLAKTHGYSPCRAEVSDMLAADTGACHICGATEVELPKALFMDHCHETGKFRGWLCAECNWMLGKAGDDPARLRKGAAYLERATAL